MAGNVDVGHLLVGHLGSQAIEVVDYRGDGPFIAGDELGGEDHQVAPANVDLLVGLQGHASQGAQGLPLAAGGDDNGFGRRQPLQVPHVDLQFRGDRENVQLLGQPGVGHHGLAVEQHLAPVLGGNIDDLLHPVDVGGEDRHDHPARSFPHQVLQGDADLPLGQGVAGALGVGGVGEQRQHPLFAVMGKAVQVRGLAGHRGLVDLEVAGMGQIALRGAHHKTHPVHDGVAYPDEFEFEGSQSQGFRGPDQTAGRSAPAGRVP